jgi:hypothetical protein
MHSNNKQQEPSHPTPEVVDADDTGPFITIARTMNGYYYAAWMAWSAISGGYAIHRSGCVRNKKRTRAENEAKAWARRENIPYRP